MFANLLQLISRRPPLDYERGFVEEVRISERLPRNRKVERLILVCWILILLKSWLMIWLVAHYHLTVNPLWVTVPTVMFALMCTAVYFWRD
jgi:hypothetical protein